MRSPCLRHAASIDKKEKVFSFSVITQYKEVKSMRNRAIFIWVLVIGLMAAWTVGTTDALAGGKKSQDQQSSGSQMGGQKDSGTSSSQMGGQSESGTTSRDMGKSGAGPSGSQGGTSGMGSGSTSGGSSSGMGTGSSGGSK
jgi:hypothetical protein